MKVVMMNYDFKVFWKGRLIYLRQFLKSKNIDFHALELFGKGSPYSFDSAHETTDDWWNCLYPGNSADEVNKEEMIEVLFKNLDEINPDIIIASSIVFFAGALGLRWAKMNGKKFIMFENAKPSQFKRNPLVQKIKDLLIGESDGMWLPSNDYDKEYPIFLNKNIHFFYGYCCVNNDLFKTENKNALTHRKFLCIARLVPIKNIDNLLHAWHIVEQNNTTYQLQIIGAGPDYEKLKNLAIELGLKTVDFLGAIDNQFISPYFYGVDAFILPSLSETWGLVVNEAMAAGLPVLLSNHINAAHTLLKEGYNGFGFEPRDSGGMAAIILKYIGLPLPDKKQFASNSLKLINDMGYENMGVRLVEALAEINSRPLKKAGWISGLLVKFWDGRYSTFAWDRL